MGRLLLPDESFTANDLLFIHSECRRWRQGALAFLHRWLILRYPEDATPEVLAALSKLWVEVCRVEGVSAEYAQIDETHVELKLGAGQTVSTGVRQTIEEFARLIETVQQYIE